MQILDYMSHPMFQKGALALPQMPLLGPMWQPLGPMEYLELYRPGMTPGGKGGGGDGGKGGGQAQQPFGIPPLPWFPPGANRPGLPGGKEMAKAGVTGMGPMGGGLGGVPMRSEFGDMVTRAMLAYLQSGGPRGAGAGARGAAAQGSGGPGVP